MDSMINRYTADLRMRSDDAYTAGGEAGQRLDRCVIVYTQRCRQAYPHVPIVIGDGPNQLIPADSNSRGRPTGKRRKSSNKARGGQWSTRSRR